MAEFSLNDLYRKAFGYVAPPFPAGGIPDPSNLLPVRDAGAVFGIKKNSKDEVPEGKVYGIFKEQSMLGQVFKLPTALRIVGKTDWFKLPNEPIISISGGNDIITTVLNRGKKRGSVKEYSNLQDYEVTIRGIAYNEDADDFPEAILQQMRQYVERGQAVEISNALCRVLNINLVCIESFDLPGNEQLPFRARAYEIKAKSDEDFELELI